MKQRVKNISYLAKVVVPLSEFTANVPKELIALPSGAEVISMNVEVLQAGTHGTNIDIGLGKEKEFFSNDLDLSTKSYYSIARGTSLKSKNTITGTLNQASISGEISLRAHYFLPSEYVYEI